jgi:hypothetical protein
VLSRRVQRASNLAHFWLASFLAGRRACVLGAGGGTGDDRGAERALADYLAQKHAAGITSGVRSPAAIPIADVITLYGRNVASQHARPRESGARLEQLFNYFSLKRLADINGELCRA